MTPRLQGETCKFFTTPLSRNSQKRLEHKENQTKYTEMSRKPRSHVKIPIHQTWTIALQTWFQILLLVFSACVSKWYFTRTEFLLWLSSKLLCFVFRKTQHEFHTSLLRYKRFAVFWPTSYCPSVSSSTTLFFILFSTE